MSEGNPQTVQGTETKEAGESREAAAVKIEEEFADVLAELRSTEGWREWVPLKRAGKGEQKEYLEEAFNHGSIVVLCDGWLKELPETMSEQINRYVSAVGDFHRVYDSRVSPISRKEDFREVFAIASPESDDGGLWMMFEQLEPDFFS